MALKLQRIAVVGHCRGDVSDSPEDSAGFFPDATAAKSQASNLMMITRQKAELGRAASQSAAYKK
jgi:hypothetical protein